MVFQSNAQEGKQAKVSLDYQKYKLQQGSIPEKWEDGMRSSGEKGTYEWWYFDGHMDDGSTVVIIFYTKPFVNINKGLKPMATVEINRPDGTKITSVIQSRDFHASKDSCNVTVGKNYFRGNLKNYEIYCEDEEFTLNAKINRTTESWRPQTGHVVFGEHEEEYFAWVVAVPQGKAQIEYSYKGEKVTLEGSCYHDHNWGNQSMIKLFNHWYWSRAQIGPYNVIASEMIADSKFNKDNVVVFNVSKDGKTLVDDGKKVKLYRTYGKIDPKFKKDESDDLVFIYDSPSDKRRYEYYLFKEKNILEFDLLASSIDNKLMLHLAKMLTGFNGAYYRITGKAQIRVFENDQLIEQHESPIAIWELMYFGEPK